MTIIILFVYCSRTLQGSLAKAKAFGYKLIFMFDVYMGLLQPYGFQINTYKY